MSTETGHSLPGVKHTPTDVDHTSMDVGRVWHRLDRTWAHFCRHRPGWGQRRPRSAKNGPCAAKHGTTSAKSRPRRRSGDFLGKLSLSNATYARGRTAIRELALSEPEVSSGWPTPPQHRPLACREKALCCGEVVHPSPFGPHPAAHGVAGVLRRSWPPLHLRPSPISKWRGWGST